jgi:hypothetical protein
MVPPNTQLQDETYIINPSTTLFTAVDIYSRPIPATTTVKIDIKTSSSDIVNPITLRSVHVIASIANRHGRACVLLRFEGF